MLRLAWFVLGWTTSETECTVDVGIEGICSLIMASLLICGELLSSLYQGTDGGLPYSTQGEWDNIFIPEYIMEAAFCSCNL